MLATLPLSPLDVLSSRNSVAVHELPVVDGDPWDSFGIPSLGPPADYDYFLALYNASEKDNSQFSEFQAASGCFG
jgi:hypothetical protein